MRFLRRIAPVLCAVGLAAIASACGGGGGAPPAPAPATPTPNPAFTAAQGAITLIPGSGTALGSDLLPTSADGVLLAQVPTTPTAPPGNGSLVQYAVTVTDAAGTTPASVQRGPQLQRATLAQRIAEDRALREADGLRETRFDPAALQRTFARVRLQPATPAAAGRRTRAASGTVGATRQFSIITSNIGNTGGCAGGTTSGTYQCHKTITATLEAVGAHGNVWVDNASLATVGEFTNVPGEFQTIAQKFDSYYATETAAFGPAWFPGTQPLVPSINGNQCDAQGNPLPRAQWKSVDLGGGTGTSIDVVITDALAGTGEGGYYYIVDEFPQTVWDCASQPKPLSNETSMFVITGNNYTPGPNLPQFNEAFWLNADVPRGMAHELQHLLHARTKAFLRQINGLPAVSDISTIDEGCSMLAEDLAADGVHIDTPRYTYSFLLEPSLFSLSAFTGFQPNPTSTATNPPYGWYSNTAGSYGQAYLLLRYLYDRFGPAALAAIYASTSPGIGPAVDAAGGEPFPQLYREFATALAAQSAPLPHDSRYGFSAALVLRGTVQVPSRRSGALSIRTLTFGGPQPPETFANNVPNGFLALAPGTTGTTFVVDGATLFLPAANGAQGSTILVTGTGLPAFQGALVQGALPTPAPAAL